MIISFYGWFAKQIPAICFASRYFIFFFFFFLSLFWMVGSMDLANCHRYSQNSNGSAMGFMGDNTSFVSKILIPFHLFQVEWKTLVEKVLEVWKKSKFSQMVWQIKNCLWIMINVLKVYKSVWHERRLSHNLVSIFQWKICHLEKVRNVEYLRQHSTDLNQIFSKMIDFWLAS